MMNSMVGAGRAEALEPAVLLAAAVALVARRSGTRMLAFKGLAAVEYGLRDPRPSADVDVFVEPERLHPFIDSLAERGWLQRTSDPDVATFPRHSISLFHPEWSLDIDVHFRYPGIELEPTESFEKLWMQRTTLWCGSQPVQIPGLADSILIAALHSLRALWIGRHELELEALIARCRSVDADQLVVRARELNALATARPFLERLGPPRRDIDWGEPSAEWRLRTRVSEPMHRRALHWKRATWRERAGQVRIALFPPITTLIKDTTTTHLPPLAAARAYLRRWRRGLASVPEVLPIILARKSGRSGDHAEHVDERSHARL
ncbi:nucleotidyltransferase family protein [Leifsonia sp. TF02-11]|nr:nucleotidyltransferase family protein [Leifsonia sp. TF02-11]